MKKKLVFGILAILAIITILCGTLFYGSVSTRHGGKMVNDTICKLPPPPLDSGLFVGEVRQYGAISKQIYKELDSCDVFNSHIIYGWWFTPHEACDKNLFLHTNDTFEFKDYKVTETGDVTEIYKTGKFQVEDDFLFLEGSDGWTYYFKIIESDGQKYITRKEGDGYEYYLVKGTE